MQVRSTFIGGVSPFAQRIPESMAQLPSRIVTLGNSTPRYEQTARLKQPGKREVGYRNNATKIKAYVADHPGSWSQEIAIGTGLSYETTKLTLQRMAERGVLQRATDSSHIGQKWLYTVTGVDIPQEAKSIRCQIFDYIKANPGTFRDPVIALVGRKSGGSALCSLVKAGLVRGEVWATGTHYYVVES